MATIEWIPVERKLPLNDTDSLYLVALQDGETGLAWFAELDGDAYWNVPTDFSSSGVTHWAHLPKHPRSLSKELEEGE